MTSKSKREAREQFTRLPRGSVKIGVERDELASVKINYQLRKGRISDKDGAGKPHRSTIELSLLKQQRVQKFSWIIARQGNA